MKINYLLVLIFFVIAFFFMVFILYVKGIIISPIIIVCVVMSFIGVLGIIFVTEVVEKKKTVSKSMQAVKELQKMWNKDNPEDKIEIMEGSMKKRVFPDGKNYVATRMKRTSTQRVVVMVYCIEDHDLVDWDMTPKPAKLSDVFFGFDPGHRGAMGGGGYNDRYQRPYNRNDRWSGYGNDRYYHDDYGSGYTPPAPVPTGQQQTQNTKKEVID